LSLIEINWNPDKKELRKFGVIALVVLGVVGIVLKFVLGVSGITALLVALAGLCIFIVTLVSVRAARLVYLGLTFAGLPIGFVVSIVLMAAFYFLILTPVGLVFKIIGRDVLERKFEPGSPTYWSPRRQRSDLEKYFHQF
jgi:NADH:ubiquinone oxidoreductase subunit 4 (subunit M)